MTQLKAVESEAPWPEGAQRGAAPPSAPQERAFPLIALIQLATFWAAIVACVDGKALAEVIDDVPRDPISAAVLTLLAGAAGAAVGFAVGLGQLRLWRNAAVGAGVGVLYGLAILAAYVAPAPIGRTLAAAGVLFLTTIAFRIRAA